MTQNVFSLAQPELLSVLDKGRNVRSFGGNQDWFPNKWQRDSGCGPTAAATILSYIGRGPNCTIIFPQLVYGSNPIDQGDMAEFMNTLWNYVTPGTIGVHRTSIFTAGVPRFMENLGYNAEFRELFFPRDIDARCTVEQAVNFIRSARENDVPIACLNYSNGALDNMCSWHWVSITALELDGDDVFVTISDEGAKKKINFGLWMKTSLFGGALVYFIPKI